MDLTLKMVFLIVRQCRAGRAFSLTWALYIGFYGSDIELEFWTRLWHYSDTNTGTCSF